MINWWSFSAFCSALGVSCKENANFFTWDPASCKENGEFFKRYLEADKFLSFLQTVVFNNLDASVDVKLKSVKDSPFVRQCEINSRLLQKRIENNDSLGFIWSDSSHCKEDAYVISKDNGSKHINFPTTFSVALTPEQAKQFVETFNLISETSVIPNYGIATPSYYSNFKEMN